MIDETLKKVISRQRDQLNQFMEREAAWQAWRSELISLWNNRNAGEGALARFVEHLLRSGPQPIPEAKK